MSRIPGESIYFDQLYIVMLLIFSGIGGRAIASFGCIPALATMEFSRVLTLGLEAIMATTLGSTTVAVGA